MERREADALFFAAEQVGSHDVVCLGELHVVEGMGGQIDGHLGTLGTEVHGYQQQFVAILAQEGIRPGTDVQLPIALRDETGEVYCIREKSQA